MARLESHPLHPGGTVPLFIAAGVLKQPEQVEPFLSLEDPSLVPTLTFGSFTYEEWSGNATSAHLTDFVYYRHLGMAGNAKGLPNGGREAMRRLKLPIRLLTQMGVKTIVSITNLPHEQAIDVIPDLAEEAAALEPTAIEVNLSCPNGVMEDGSLHPPVCNNADASGEVMQASRNRVGTEVCVGAKDAPHVTSLHDKVDQSAVGRLLLAVNPFINFMTGINTIGGQSFPEITSTGGKGGMSGPAVANIARDWLRSALANAAAHVAILSCGGIETINLRTELPLRLRLGAMLVGGAQEFYRAEQPASLADQWAGLFS